MKYDFNLMKMYDEEPMTSNPDLEEEEVVEEPEVPEVEEPVIDPGTIKGGLKGETRDGLTKDGTGEEEEEEEDPEYGYARDLEDIESAAEGDLDITELTENAITYTDSDHTHVLDDETDVSTITNHDYVLVVDPGRHAAVKAAKDAYDEAAMKEVSDKYAEE